jgi:hypothetical protein
MQSIAVLPKAAMDGAGRTASDPGEFTLQGWGLPGVGRKFFARVFWYFMNIKKNSRFLVMAQIALRGLAAAPILQAPP